MTDTTDLLQIKIEEAKKQLPQDTLNAIAAVPWQAEILKMRETKGYTFEQLGDLELETELVLCGLLNPKDYLTEIENRMKISKIQANELVNEMNEKVFTKIKEELIKNTERKNDFAKNQTEKEIDDTEILSSSGIEIISDEKKETLPVIEKLELNTTKEPVKPFMPDLVYEKKEETHPILAQKLSGFVKNEIKETDHALNNLTKMSAPVTSNEKPKIPSTDPYREIPE